MAVKKTRAEKEQPPDAETGAAAPQPPAPEAVPVDPAPDSDDPVVLLARLEAIDKQHEKDERREAEEEHERRRRMMAPHGKPGFTRARTAEKARELGMWLLEIAAQLREPRETSPIRNPARYIAIVRKMWATLQGLDGHDVTTRRALDAAILLDVGREKLSRGAEERDVLLWLTGEAQDQDPEGLGRIEHEPWRAALAAWRGFGRQSRGGNPKTRYSGYAVLFELLSPFHLTGAKDRKNFTDAITGAQRSTREAAKTTTKSKAIAAIALNGGADSEESHLVSGTKRRPST